MRDWSAVDMSMAPPGYRELRTDCVAVRVPGLRHFWLGGADWQDWLQGQATNDVTKDCRFCLTKPTGQLLAVCSLWHEDGRALVATIDNRRSPRDVIEERVDQTVILEDVTLEQVTGPVSCVQGPNAPGEGFLSDRTGSGGCEYVGENDLPLLSEEAFGLATLESGIPLLGIDTDEKTLPPELGAVFDDTHDCYTKGCYTGQEVLMRIHSRGHTNKTWIGLKSGSPMEAGSSVRFEGREVGVVHRAAKSPLFGEIASATLRNDAAQEGTAVEVEGKPATVVELPFLR